VHDVANTASLAEHGRYRFRSRPRQVEILFVRAWLVGKSDDEHDDVRIT
jgi:hypothetical protein